MSSKRSEKVSQKTIAFTKKLKINRIKAGTDDDSLAYWKLWEVVVDYFKLNNDEYLELVNLESKQ